ncbi:MAG TPA: AmmeMemoRadiSam system protein A [Vicinamibacterales bacterium]|nr:AmmeMemoRadiSam system protein A [Vicinamibacterales bacterium]
MFTEEQKRALVEIARAAVTDVATGSSGRVVAAQAGDFPDASGAFVTLKRDGRLRGCIGTLECRRSLADEVARVAASAAREDPRFEPLRASELQGLDVEVSVLGPLEAIDPFDSHAFEIGRHGLVVEQGLRRGLLLPQVATECGWGREEFLTNTCVKAGLAPDAWRHGATVYRFEGEAFGSNP